MAEKCSKKITTRKVWEEKCGRKSVAGKPQQKKCSRKSVAEKPWKQNATRRKRYGFHMCSVELMNLVESFPCKSVGCPLGILGLVVEWF